MRGKYSRNAGVWRADEILTGAAFRMKATKLGDEARAKFTLNHV